MGPDCEERIVRACLAAVARRAGFSLVVSYEELEREYSAGLSLSLVPDDEAGCIRISSLEAGA